MSTGPASRFGIVARFFGNTVSEAAAFAAGVAIGPVLGPPVQALRNKVNAAYPLVPPDVGTLAEGVAQGQVDDAAARQWAHERGFGNEAFDALIAIANVGPGMAQAFNLWRRRQIDEAGFRRVLKRLGLEDEWANALWNVREEILDPGDLARAIHRGLIPDPGLLEGVGRPGAGNVPAYPVYPVDAIAEAAGSGLDRDRLGVLVGLQGNPMGAHEAAQAEFRGVINHNDYLRAIAEGNTRNEWAEAIHDQSRQIPTARDFLENALRGYRTLPEAIAGAELHGMTPEHATLIYQNQGRPMIPRQITQALAWGAKFNPEPGEITDPYQASTVEGNVKPAYYEFYEALRYNLPSAFYFRTLQTQKVLTEAEAEKWYLRMAWPPELAAKVAKAYAATAGQAGKDQTRSMLEDEYKAGFIGEPEFRASLAELGFEGHDLDLAVLHADAAAIQSARGAAVTKLRKMYEEDKISEAAFHGALAALGMHEVPLAREIEYANIVKGA